MIERPDRPTAFMGILILLVILLAFVLFLMVISGTPGAREKWQFVSNNTITYMTVDSDDTLYAFFNNSVVAIDNGGDLMWNLTFPDDVRICGDRITPWYRYVHNGSEQFATGTENTPVFDIAGGRFYLYVQPGGPSCSMENPYRYRSDAPDLPIDTNKTIVAISPGGEILWDVTIDGPATAFDDTFIEAINDRVYVFHQYNETVLDRDGRVLFSLADVSDPAAIGPDGMVFVSKSSPYDTSGNIWLSGMDFRIPSGTIEAYYPNGTLCWSQYVDLSLVSTYDEGCHTMPVYRDGRLYLPARDGIAVLGRNGSLLWTRTFAGQQNLDLFGLMPFDSDGNVYLKDIMSSVIFYVIDRNGNERQGNWTWPDAGRITAARNGILYYLNYTGSQGNRTLEAPDTMCVTARNIVEGKDLWNFTLPVVNTTTVTIDDRNVYDYFGEVPYGSGTRYAELLVLSNQVNCTLSCPGQHLEDALVTVKSRMDDASLYPGNDVIYASLYTMSYEDPVRFNVSRCVYSSNIYALDRNGTLLWSKPLDSIVRLAQVKDNTLYYSAGGRISKTQTDLAAGVALLAAAYVFIKFFCIGAVSRLKERMPKNRNRSRVFDYIRDDPGASLYEICRGTGLNVGTVRYHLWILGANHRIVSLQTDKKYVRYFPNSHTYSDEEQLVLSVMKRDSMRRVLGVLAEKPGLTNRELAAITGIKESAMSRYMIELTEKGIVDRLSMDNRHVYRIRSEYVPAVEMSIGRMGTLNH